MAKNGYRIFDTDTHVGPSMDVLEPYMDPTERALLAPFAEFRAVAKRTGQVTYRMGVRTYERRLGQADPGSTQANGAYMAGFTGAHKGRDPVPTVDHDVHSRIQDMDYEGVDVNLLLPLRLVRDVHRGAGPGPRTGGCSAPTTAGWPITVAPIRTAWWSDPALRDETLQAACKSSTAAPTSAGHGASLSTPRTANRLTIRISSRTGPPRRSTTCPSCCTRSPVMPPYAPGGLDTWDNLWLQRSAAHPWCGMRNMASVIGSGALDRYPDLRLGCLEAGHSWLPFWVKRLDEHAESIASALPPLQHTPSEYVQSGRYFQSIEMSEGPELTRMVAEQLGDGILMYASDYPHGESWFPKSVETVMSWNLSDDLKQKLFWENPLRFYRRYAGVTAAAASD